MDELVIHEWWSGGRLYRLVNDPGLAPLGSTYREYYVVQTPAVNGSWITATNAVHHMAHGMEQLIAALQSQGLECTPADPAGFATTHRHGLPEGLMAGEIADIITRPQGEVN